MCLNDFRAIFTDLMVSQIHDDYTYASIKVSQNNRHHPFNVVEFEILKEGEYFISAVQKSKRYMQHSDGYRYSNARMILAKKLDDNQLEYVQDYSEWDREANLQLKNLPIGKYQLFVDINWMCEQSGREYAISSYGVERTNFTEVTSTYKTIGDAAYAFLRRIDKALEFNEKQRNPFQAHYISDVYVVSQFIGPFYCNVFQNENHEGYSLKLSITKNGIEGVRYVYSTNGVEFEEDKEFTIDLAPGMSYFMISRIEATSYSGGGSSYSMVKHK